MPKRPSADWNRTAEAVRAARIAAGYRSQDEAAEAAGIGITTWRLIEGAKRTAYTPAVAFAVTHLFGWTPDALEDIANGGPIPPVVVDDAQVPTNVLERLERVEALTQELEGLTRLLLFRLGERGLVGLDGEDSQDAPRSSQKRPPRPGRSR